MVSRDELLMGCIIRARGSRLLRTKLCSSIHFPPCDLASKEEEIAQKALDCSCKLADKVDNTALHGRISRQQ